MAELKMKFDDDKEIVISEVKENEPFTFQLQKVNYEIGKGMKVKQNSNTFTFTDGKKTFKIYIE